MSVSRTVRVGRPVRSSKAVKTVKDEINDLIEEYVSIEGQIAELTLKLKDIESETYEKMKLIAIKQYTSEHAEAERYKPVGKSSRLIDVKKFKNMVSESDFMKAIVVPIGSAKLFISTKALDSIATTTPGEVKPETIRIKRRKV